MTRKSNRADTLRPLVERGLSLREMAKATGWSRGAVSGVLFRAGLNAGKERPAWVQKGDLKNPAWRRAADLYLQGKSRAEIAEAMGCNLESAGRHLRRARRKGVAVAPLPRVVPAPPPSALRPLKRRRIATIKPGPPVSPMPDLEPIYGRFGEKCQFIAGEPNDGQPFQCSHPRLVGRPYCDGHARLCRAAHPEAAP